MKSWIGRFFLLSSLFGTVLLAADSNSAETLSIEETWNINKLAHWHKVLTIVPKQTTDKFSVSFEILPMSEIVAEAFDQRKDLVFSSSHAAGQNCFGLTVNTLSEQAKKDLISKIAIFNAEEKEKKRTLFLDVIQTREVDNKQSIAFIISIGTLYDDLLFDNLVKLFGGLDLLDQAISSGLKILQKRGKVGLKNPL